MALASKTFRKIKLAAAILVLLLVTVPVLADPFVQFDYSSLRLYYSAGSERELTITDTLSSLAAITLKEGLSLQDGPALLFGGSAFDVALQAEVGSAAEGYAMVGTFTASDIVGTRFDATFTSTDVRLLSSNQGTLVIEGVLTGVGDNSILVSDAAGGGWSFAGSVGTVDLANPGPYRAGQLFQMTFGVDGATLEDLFDNGEKDGGSGIMHGTIYAVSVPAPAAIALATVGLGLVGWWMRKHT